MLLNYQINQNPDSQLTPIIFIHGLFGSLSNLGMLARDFTETRTVVQLDVRNHGLSEHSDLMNYALMAQDVIETLNSLNIQNFSVVGHSMGGKIAMKVADLARDRVEKLIVLDMTPIQYTDNHHNAIIKALFAVQQANVVSRLDATKIMREYLAEEMVIQFLLKSFNKGQWLFHVEALKQHYTDILSWENIQPLDIPTLFLKGGNSYYISQPEHFSAIEQQFSHAQVKTIENVGHWLHTEKTTEVLDQIKIFVA